MLTNKEIHNLISSFGLATESEEHTKVFIETMRVADLLKQEELEEYIVETIEEVLN